MAEKKPISCNPHDIWKNAREIVESSQINLLGYFKGVLETCFTTEGVKKIISGGVTKKKKRPSGYNLFIGACMREGKGMKTCSTEWKGTGNEEKQRWNEEAKLG